MSSNTSQSSGVSSNTNIRKSYFLSRSMRTALSRLRLRAKLRLERLGRKSSIPSYRRHISTAYAQDSELPQDFDALSLSQSIDLISSHNPQPLWESSTSAAAHIPIKNAKSEISLGLAFRYSRMLLHRPAGFGKTTFLRELRQFCDVTGDLHNDSDRDLKIFSPENIQSSYVAAHQAKYLTLHFDLANLLDPGDSDTLTEAGIRERLMSEIRGTLDEYVRRYFAKGFLGALPINDPSELSLTQICHYIPRQSANITLVTVDNYDAPLLNAPPGKLTMVEGVIEELLYRDVLSVFGGFNWAQVKLLIMGSGMRDPAPAKRLATCLGLIDCTMYPRYADLIGLTMAEINEAIRKMVEDEAMHSALLKEVEDTCWRELFVEENSSDVVAIVCSKEVTDFLAGYLTKFGSSRT